MAGKIISLKRNSFVLFIWSFLPVLIAGFIMEYNLFFISPSAAKITAIIVFIIAIVLGILALNGNSRVVEIDNLGIVVYKSLNKKNNNILRFNEEDIEEIYISKTSNLIQLKMTNDSKYMLVAFNYFPSSGEEIFFKLKAELYRYFQHKITSQPDKILSEYLTSEIVPESVKNKDQSNKVVIDVLIILEIIFSILPFMYSMLAIIWGLCNIGILFINLLLKI